jgi:hypothetical protein
MANSTAIRKSFYAAIVIAVSTADIATIGRTIDATFSAARL